MKRLPAPSTATPDGAATCALIAGPPSPKKALWQSGGSNAGRPPQLPTIVMIDPSEDTLLIRCLLPSAPSATSKFPLLSTSRLRGPPRKVLVAVVPSAPHGGCIGTREQGRPATVVMAPPGEIFLINCQVHQPSVSASLT